MEENIVHEMNFWHDMKSTNFDWDLIWLFPDLFSVYIHLNTHLGKLSLLPNSNAGNEHVNHWN